MPEYSDLHKLFAARFPCSGPPAIYRAPGRVNLIGEHTDYNLGFVLPIAIDFATWAVVAPNDHGRLRIRSENLNETREWAVADIPGLRPMRDWTDYVIGVARQIPHLGARDVLIYSTVPVGAGLSSSAALEVSVALALGSDARGIALAKLARRSENDFVGNPCGIMDQYVSVCGRAGAAIKIDCRSLDHQAVTLPGGVSIVVVNTMVKHALAGSAYKDRVRECAAAVEILKTQYPAIESLRDVTPGDFEAAAHLLPEVVARRARHIVTEDVRVNHFVEASQAGDLTAMGRLLVESHRSLQYDYEVSCEELDFLVDTALALDGVYGARMTGGGFGGCTVNLVEANRVESFKEIVGEAYKDATKLPPRIFVCAPGAGVGELEF